MLLCLPNMIMWLLSFFVLIWLITLPICIAEHLGANDPNLWRIMMVDNFYAVGVSVLISIFAYMFIVLSKSVSFFAIFTGSDIRIMLLS